MNKCILLGRLSKDVELNFAQGSGTAIARTSLAVNRKFKKGETDFLNIVAFGKTAENMNKFFKKGSMILLEAHAQSGSYDAKDGTKRYTMDFIVDSFDFVGSNGTGTEGTQGAGAEKPNLDSDFTPVDEGDMPF